MQFTRNTGAVLQRAHMSPGFDPAKTFIFRDTDYIGQLYPVALQIQPLDGRRVGKVYGLAVASQRGILGLGLLREKG